MIGRHSLTSYHIRSDNGLGSIPAPESPGSSSSATQQTSTTASSQPTSQSAISTTMPPGSSSTLSSGAGMTTSSDSSEKSSPLSADKQSPPSATSGISTNLSSQNSAGPTAPPAKITLSSHATLLQRLRIPIICVAVILPCLLLCAGLVLFRRGRQRRRNALRTPGRPDSYDNSFVSPGWRGESETFLIPNPEWRTPGVDTPITSTRMSVYTSTAPESPGGAVGEDVPLTNYPQPQPLEKVHTCLPSVSVTQPGSDSTHPVCVCFATTRTETFIDAPPPAYEPRNQPQ